MFVIGFNHLLSVGFILSRVAWFVPFFFFCSGLFVVRRCSVLLFVVCCLRLFRARALLFVGCCLMWLFVFVCSCLLSVFGCFWFVGVCGLLLCIVRCVWFDACWSLLVMCCCLCACLFVVFVVLVCVLQCLLLALSRLLCVAVCCLCIVVCWLRSDVLACCVIAG